MDMRKALRGCLRCLILGGVNMLCYAEGFQMDLPESSVVNLGAEYLSRYESWEWFRNSQRGGDYDYSFIRVRAKVSYEKDFIQLFAEPQYVTMMGIPDDAVSPLPFGPSGMGGLYYSHNHENNPSEAALHQGYMGFNIFAHEGMFLRFGRMEYADALEAVRKEDGKKFNALKNMRLSDRMISAFEWSAFGRSFDGASGGYRNEDWNFTSAFLMPTQGGWEKEFGETIDAIEIQALTLTLRKDFGIPDTESALHYYRYNDNREIIQRVDNVQTSSVSGVDVDIQMIGGHLLGIYSAGHGEVDFLVWGGIQWGDWYELTHRAYAFTIEAGYQFTSLSCKPWFRLGFSAGSGDPDAADREHETFFQMAPGTRKYQLLPFYDFMNSQDFFTQVIVKPRDDLLFRMEFHQVRLSEDSDRWYMGSGPTQESGDVFGYLGRPSGGDESLASELDMIVDYSINQFFKVIGCYSRVFGKEVIKNLYPEEDEAQFCSVELQFKY